MSDKLTTALEAFPNLANRALVMLMQDPSNATKVQEWIKEQAQHDVRFSRLGEKAELDLDNRIECVI